MSDSKDDDSFSKVGFSDTESICGSNNKNENGEEEEKQQQKIEVQLPPNFSAGESKAGGDGAAAGAASDAGSSTSSSEVSSFIPIRTFGKMKVAADDDDDGDKKPAAITSTCNNSAAKEGGGATTTAAADDGKSKDSLTPREKSLGDLVKDAKEALKILEGIPKEMRKKDDEESTVGSWSVVSGAAGNVTTTKTDGDDDSSIAASSIISGFDMISLNGDSKKRCKRCSFLNIPKDTICKGCNVALVANPTLAADAKLAQYLQAQEENEAFKDVVYEEKKRNAMGQQPILFRAHTLANDIHAAVASCRSGLGPRVTLPLFQRPTSNKYNEQEQLFSAIPTANLAILASRFIDKVDAIATGSDGNTIESIDLCYCFTEDHPWRMTQIRQDGFGPNFFFGSNVEAAYHAYEKCRGRGRPSLLDCGVMPTISEGISGTQELVGEVPPNTKGWIAAIINKNNLSGGAGQGDVRIAVKGGGTAWIYARQESVESLPLVFLNADEIAEVFVDHLVAALKRTCNDFFCRHGTSEADVSFSVGQNSSPKRQKVVALRNYENFHGMAPGTATDGMLETSSAGIQGWANASCFNKREDDEALARAIQASLEDSEQGWHPQTSAEDDKALVQATQVSSADTKQDVHSQTSKSLPIRKDGVGVDDDDLDGLERVGAVADDIRTKNLQAAATLLEKSGQDGNPQTSADQVTEGSQILMTGDAESEEVDVAWENGDAKDGEDGKTSEVNADVLDGLEEEKEKVGGVDDDLDGLERVGVVSDDIRTNNLQAAASLLEKPEEPTVPLRAELKSKCLEVLKGLQTHQHGWLFNVPVDPVELGLHDYFDIIKQPMDLGTIQKKLVSGNYHDIDNFRADINLTFENALTYNEEGSVVYDMAKELKSKFETDYKKLLLPQLEEAEDNKEYWLQNRKREAKPPSPPSKPLEYTNKNKRPGVTLPIGWRCVWSKSRQRWYFFDAHTGSSVWKWPPSCEQEEPQYTTKKPPHEE